MKPVTVGAVALELAKQDGRGRRLFEARERERLLAAFDESGLTQVAFARREGVNYYTFAGWLRQRRLSRESGMEGPERAFVEVGLPRGGYAMELVLPGGLVVRAQEAWQLVECVKGLR
jgi:transposase-like protein